MRARLPSFRAKMRRAEDCVREALATGARWYVAWSGGKDSLCVLALACAIQPGLAAVWSDDELEHPGQESYVPTAAAALGARLTIVRGYAPHADWFRPWAEQPFWREPLTEMVWLEQRMEPWSRASGYTGVFVGLRQEEAGHRRQYLRAMGRLHLARDEQWRCNPLSGWTVQDVWALVADRELPYSAVYDRLTEIGVPREIQRVGPLPLSEGWVLKAGWPEVYRRLLVRYGRRWTA